VEDVLNLGDEVEVRVDDIDPQGKVSLSLASAPPPSSAPSYAPAARPADGIVEVSFEDSFDGEISADLGDLGPVDVPVPDGGGREAGAGRGPRRGPRRSGGRR